MNIRELEESDIDEVARLWHDGWRDGHLAIVPADLTRLRTLDSFRERLVALRPTIRVASDSGAIVGFCSVRGSEPLSALRCADRARLRRRSRAHG